VVSTDRDDPTAVAGLEKMFEADPVNPERPALTLWRVPASPSRRRVALEAAWLTASASPADLSQACDGRDDTWWRTESVQRPGDWLQVTLPAPRRLDRIELDVDGDGRLGARELQLIVSSEGGSFVPAATLPGRPPLDDQRVEERPIARSSC
jgi:hypothetical protein